MLNRREKVKICLILSDGLPRGGPDYCGEYAEKDTQQAIMEMRGKKIRPIIVGVGFCTNQLRNLYGDEIFLDATDPRKLPQKLKHVFQRIIRGSV